MCNFISKTVLKTVHCPSFSKCISQRCKTTVVLSFCVCDPVYNVRTRLRDSLLSIYIYIYGCMYIYLLEITKTIQNYRTDLYAVFCKEIRIFQQRFIFHKMCFLTDLDSDLKASNTVCDLLYCF